MTPILILDGGLGTSLEQKYHVRFGPSTPLWSTDAVVTTPHTVLACQADFARVPVDVLLTATYQVSERGFAQTGSGIDRAGIPEMLERAVCIAEAAARQGGSGSGTSVALSLGPYGATMTPSQ
ncbi:hypothetical protein E4U42_002143, partial [Claviceps africana]